MSSKYDFGSRVQDKDMFKQVKNKYPTRGVISRRAGEIISMDLVDMQNKKREGYKYILNCIRVLLFS